VLLGGKFSSAKSGERGLKKQTTSVEKRIFNSCQKCPRIKGARGGGNRNTRGWSQKLKGLGGFRGASGQQNANRRGRKRGAMEVEVNVSAQSEIRSNKENEDRFLKALRSHFNSELHILII